MEDFQLVSLYFGLFCFCCFVLLCAIGLIGHLLSALIFLQPTFRRRSINVFLFALSVVDAALLVVSLPVLGSGPLATFYAQSRFTDRLYNVSLVYLFPVSLILYFSSIWLLVLVSFERWLAVCKPLVVARQCTRKRALCSIVLVLAVGTLLNISRWWDFTMVGGHPVAVLRANVIYMRVMLGAQSVFHYVTPVTALIFFTSAMIRTLRTRSSVQIALTHNQIESRSSAAKMVVWVALTFACFHFSAFVLCCLEWFIPDWFDSYVGAAVSDCSNLLAVLNSAVAPLFYFKHSSRYRACVKLLVSKCTWPVDQYVVGTAHLVTRAELRYSSRLPGRKVQSVAKLNEPEHQPLRRSLTLSGGRELDQIREKFPAATSPPISPFECSPGPSSGQHWHSMYNFEQRRFFPEDMKLPASPAVPKESTPSPSCELYWHTVGDVQIHFFLEDGQEETFL